MATESEETPGRAICTAITGSASGRFNYLLLTRDDQRAIQATAERFGPRLAAAFGAERAAFQAIAKRCDDSGLFLGSHSAPGGHLVTYLVESSADAGTIMLGAARSPKSRGQLAHAIGLPDARLDASLRLLSAIGYLREAVQEYSANVLVLTADEGALMQQALSLGRQVIRCWLIAHFDEIKDALVDLNSMQHGLPFELPFSEVWHDIFGVASRELAQSGFYVGPNYNDYPFRGFVPLVWDASLRQQAWP